MLVVYEKPIIQKLTDVIYEANVTNRKIEKIILTKDEWKEFIRISNAYCIVDPVQSVGFNWDFFAGVHIEKAKE